MAAKYDPNVVILDGGRNDLFAPREAIFDAMVSTIAGARRPWRAARIVFIRPRLLARPTDDLGFDDEFIARQFAEPGAQDVVVIDPITGSLARIPRHCSSRTEFTLMGRVN